MRIPYVNKHTMLEGTVLFGRRRPHRRSSCRGARQLGGMGGGAYIRVRATHEAEVSRPEVAISACTTCATTTVQPEVHEPQGKPDVHEPQPPPKGKAQATQRCIALARLACPPLLRRLLLSLLLLLCRGFGMGGCTNIRVRSPA